MPGNRIDKIQFRIQYLYIRGRCSFWAVEYFRHFRISKNIIANLIKYLHKVFDNLSGFFCASDLFSHSLGFMLNPGV